MSIPKAVILDDDAELRNFVHAIISKADFSSQAVGTFDEFKTAIEEQSPDLVVLDLSLEETDGVEVLRFMSQENLRPNVVLISGFEERLINTAMKVGESYGLNMLGSLQKPITPSALRDILDRIPKPASEIGHQDIESAIQRDDLFLNYQPKVDLKTGRVLSAEALVRWNNPERGIIFPDQFIDLAERSGLIEPMTETILTKAISDCKRWQQQGFDVSVAVNLSASALEDLNFPSRVDDKLKTEGLSPSKLILEVTESTAMTDVNTTMDVLTRLRIKGISISLDDFGTGYSSLVELHRMPFSELKIDRSFVMAADKDSDARIIVEAVLSMAHALKLKVVAEGVETEQHWSMLRDLGCDMAQGYYLSRPIPYEDFINWMADRQSP